MKSTGWTALAMLVPAIGAAEWRPLPIWGGGYVQNVIVAPSAHRVWYAYADVGGPYRSDDAGRTWRALHGNMSIGDRMRRCDRVRSMSVDPRDADSFVMAGGDNPWCPGGVCVSRDGGRSFRRTLVARYYGNDSRRTLGQVLDRNPFAPDELVTAADVDGIFTSSDNGETWTPRGRENCLFCEVKYDRVRKGRIYAAAPALGTCPCDGGVTNQPPTGTREHGFFVSEDNGLSWQELSRDIPSELVQLEGEKRLVAIVAENRVAASENGGRSWKLFEEGLVNPARGFDTLVAGDGFYVLGESDGRLWRREAEADAWVEIPRASWKSADPARETFMAYKTRPEHLAGLTVNPFDSNHWLATDWFALMESTDGGRNWVSAMKGIQPMCPFSIVCDPHSRDNVFYGVADMGLYVSNDGGRSYRLVPGCCNTAAFSSQTKGLVLWVGGKVLQDILRSRDGGRTVERPKCVGLPADMKPRGIAAFTVVAHPQKDEFWICVSGPVGPGQGGLYVSADAGDTWAYRSAGLTPGRELFVSDEFALESPQFVFSSDGAAVIRDKRGGLWWFEGASAMWRPSNVRAAGFTDFDTHAGADAQVVADPDVPGRFLVTCVDGNVAPFESTDGGRTFHRFGSLAGMVYSLSFDVHRPGVLYACGRDELYLSRDGGRHFCTVKGGLDLPTGTARRIVADRGRLFFLTAGSGVWEWVDARGSD